MELKHENIFRYLLVCFIIALVGFTTTFIKTANARDAAPAATVADSVTADNTDVNRAPSSKNP